MRAPLKSFLRSFAADELDSQKSLFPYQKLVDFSSYDIPLDELRVSDFDSDLKKENSLVADFNEFNSLLKGGKTVEQALKLMCLKEVPKGSAEEVLERLKADWAERGLKNLIDLLKTYAADDVRALGQVMRQTNIEFFEKTGLDLFKNFFTLPACSLQTCLLLSNNLSSFYYISDEYIDNLFMESTKGGFACCWERWSKIGEPINPHQFPESEETIQAIEMYDLCNSYGNALQSNSIPVGIYSIRKIENEFAPQYLHKQHNAIIYLNYLSYAYKIKLRTAHSVGGEKKVYISNGQQNRIVRLDGYYFDAVRNQHYAFEFHDEASHSICENCEIEDGIQLSSSKKEAQKKTLAREQLIRCQGYNLESKWECCLKKHLASADPQHRQLQDFFFRARIGNLTHNRTYVSDRIGTSDEKILADIEDRTLTGFILCDGDTPAHIKERLSPFAPFFKKVIITKKDLSPAMQTIAEKLDYKMINTPTLINSWFMKQELIHTDLVIYYLKLGLKLFNITLIIESELSSPFSKYIDGLLKARNEADKDGNVLKSMLNKLIINSTYGSMLRNPAKGKKTYICDKKRALKLMESDYFVEAEVMGDEDSSENESTLYEVSVHARSVTHRFPRSVGSTILMLGKISLMNFVHNYLQKYIPPQLLAIALCDTDSIVCVLGRESLEACVPKHLKREFEDDSRRLLAKFADKSRYNRAGLWKLEQSFKELIALIPKSYFGVDKDDPSKNKIVMKSIPKNQNSHLLTLENMRAATGLSPKPQAASVCSIRNAYGRTVTFKGIRSVFGTVMKKAYVHDCGLHCKPFDHL